MKPDRKNPLLTARLYFPFAIATAQSAQVQTTRYWDLNGTTVHHISSSITGAGTSLAKAGAILALSGANNYTGATNITGGTLDATASPSSIWARV